MYDKKLSEIFDGRINSTSGQLQDEKGFPWGFRSHESKVKKTKVLYAIGDSWIDSIFFDRVFHNDYPEYFLINRAMGGSSNSHIIDQLRNDMQLLKTLNCSVYILVAFSEVGRSLKDFEYVSPKYFKNAHHYLGEILQKQYLSVKQVLTGHNAYVTTAFVSNNFNTHPSIIDCCVDGVQEKPVDVYTVTSNGIFEFFKDRDYTFKFELSKDIEKSLQLKNYIQSHPSVDDTLHINRYKPYEIFLEKVFLNLQKI